MSATRVKAADLVEGDYILIDTDVTPDGFRRTGRVLSVHTVDGWSTIRYRRSGDGAERFWSEASMRGVELAPLPVERRHQSTRSRVLLRGAPWFSAVALLAILGAVVHAPSGGGIALLIVLLWLIGCVAMVTTPEDDR